MIYSMSPVLIAFGCISVLLFYSQIKTYISVLKGKEISKLLWLNQHIGMMIGSYIATITAFLVVNMGGAPSMTLHIIGWLSPTIILVPLLIYWQNKYAKEK